jgi:uncharacterized protein YciI
MTVALWQAPGKGWDPSQGAREQNVWNEHAAFMDQLFDQGKIVLGGPMADGTGSLVIARAESVEAARAMFDTDPWALADILHVETAQEWTIFLDGRGQ